MVSSSCWAVLATLSLSVENLQETRSECTHMSSVVEPRKGLLVDHSGSRWFLVDWQILGKHRAFLVAVSNTLPTGGSSVQGPCSRAYVVSHLKCASVLWKCVRSLRHWPHCFSVPLLFGSIAFQFHCFLVSLLFSSIASSPFWPYAIDEQCYAIVRRRRGAQRSSRSFFVYGIGDS